MTQTLSLKLISSIVLVILTIGMGIVLHRTGKPYSIGYFTIHKISTIAFLVLLFSLTKNYLKGSDTTTMLVFAIIIGAISLLALIISGGMMSLDKMMDLSLPVHRVSTFVFVISLIWSLFYIFPVTN